MAKIITADDRRRELMDAWNALYAWFTNQPIPPDRWHEIDASSVDRAVAARFAEAIDRAEGVEPEWTNRLLHTEPFATLWSQVKHGRPDMRRQRLELAGAFNIGHPASPSPEPDWHGQFAKMEVPEWARKAVRPAMKRQDQRPKVFICYMKEDLGRAREIYHHLRSVGVDPWLDKEQLVHGDDWEEEIRKAVAKADLFVVCLQPRLDRPGFRQKEVSRAKEAAELRPPGTPFIIPFIVEPCELPDWCRRYHAGEYDSQPTTLEELERSIRKHCDT